MLQEAKISGNKKLYSFLEFVRTLPNEFPENEFPEAPASGEEAKSTRTTTATAAASAAAEPPAPPRKRHFKKVAMPERNVCSASMYI